MRGRHKVTSRDHPADERPTPQERSAKKTRLMGKGFNNAQAKRITDADTNADQLTEAILLCESLPKR